MTTFSFGEFMREGGWGMWPVMMLGLLALASATRYVLRPERLCLRFVANHRRGALLCGEPRFGAAVEQIDSERDREAERQATDEAGHAGEAG